MNKRNGSLRMEQRHIPAHILLIVWSILVLFPLWVMVVNSFKTRLSIYSNPFWLPQKWNFSNYIMIFKNGDFLRYFKISLIVVVVSILLVLGIGSLASYGFANWKGRIAHLVFMFMIAGMMLPIKIASIRLLEMVRRLGLLNKALSLIPIYVAMGVPIAVFILTEFIREIPRELTEAGIMDGAGRFTIYQMIIIPLLKPAMATVGIYNLVPFWNDLWFPLIFINDDNEKDAIAWCNTTFRSVPD
jgi:raffinose/stachyose/melibiose transport system permease protein